MSKDYLYSAVVRSIYDGDTIRLDIDLGFDTWIKNRAIRLFGIDAPELRGAERPEGLKAREWLEERIPPGTEITLRSIKDQTGKYGRYLGVLLHDGADLNQDMIAAGHAKIYGA